MGNGEHRRHPKSVRHPWSPGCSIYAFSAGDMNDWPEVGTVRCEAVLWHFRTRRDLRELGRLTSVLQKEEVHEGTIASYLLLYIQPARYLSCFLPWRLGRLLRRSCTTTRQISRCARLAEAERPVCPGTPSHHWERRMKGWKLASQDLPGLRFAVRSLPSSARRREGGRGGGGGV
jgi:hypothetical protein